MFRLEGATIRLFVEPYCRYIKYSAHFRIPKCLHWNRYSHSTSLSWSSGSYIDWWTELVNILESQNVYIEIDIRTATSLSWFSSSYIDWWTELVNILGPENVHCTWCIYDMIQRIAWWWLLRVETCRYMHNLFIINRCVWLKLYMLSNLI
jgi:hypothetical protein